MELLFLLVGMLVLSVAGAECAKMSSSEQLDFAATGQVMERILSVRCESHGQRQQAHEEPDGKAGCGSSRQRQRTVEEKRVQKHSFQQDGKARCGSSRQRQRTVEENSSANGREQGGHCGVRRCR